MPIHVDSALYVPTAVFEEPDIGLIYWMGDGNRYVHLYSKGNRMLVFDLDAGNAFDQNYNRYPYKAVQTNGRTYLPVYDVYEFFSLPALDVLPTEYGSLLCLHNTTRNDLDGMFLQTSRNTLKARYDAYIASLTTPSPPPSAYPSESPPPSATPSPSPSPAPMRVYLTFDDGPVGEISDGILDVLDSYGVSATFFLCGEKLGENEDAVRRIVGSRHGVGLNGYTYTEAFYSSPEAMLDELQRGNDRLERITMHRTRLVRTPFGSRPRMTDELCRAMTDGGYRFWDWNIDPNDSETSVSAAVIVTRVVAALQAYKLSAPPVILLHERQATLEALPAILNYMLANNYIFVVCQPNENPINQINYIN